MALGFGGSEVTHLLQWAEPGTVFFDVGANVGYHSLAVATLRPDVVVHAIEPSPDAGARFQVWSTELPNVHLHAIAVGDHSRRVLLDHPKDGVGTRIVAELDEANDNVGTEVTTLDKL